MSQTTAYSRDDVLIDMQGVTFGYDPATPVLRDLNAQIRDVVRPGHTQGQIVGMLGPSGIGKTTLFNLLAGLEEPTTGTITVGPERKPATAGMVGVVAQSYPLFAHRTVLSNLVVAARQGGSPRAEAGERAREYLARFGMSAHAEKYPAQLSGGQRQRVAIAQQLLCSECYLVMDEPFSGLDVVALENVQRLLLEVAGQHEHNTLIVVTHDVSAALAVSDTVWLMGRDRDERGGVVPGARIQEVLDLAEMGLAWREDLTHDARFLELEAQIKERFRTL